MAATKAAGKGASKAKKKTNVDKLAKAGVLNTAHCSDKHQAAINKLSAGEVAALIKVKKKVGRHLGTSSAAKQAGRPWVL